MAAHDFGGEPATLSFCPDGQATVRIGDEHESGCAARLDPRGRTLTLTVDPFGLHSVYWTQVGAVFWFASDLGVLRPLVRSRGLDHVAQHGFLCFSHVPSPLTLIDGVSLLPAGSRIVVTDGGQQCERWNRWQEAEPEPLCEDAAVAMLRAHLRVAVEQRLGGDRTVGVFVSGGLDSSLIAALLVEAGARVHLFTLDFGPPWDQEIACARQVAAHLKQPLHVVPARAKQVRAALAATARALQQPFGDGVTVPLYLLGQAAAEHVGVVFNGEGGDQLWGGWANKPMVAAELYGAPNFDREAAYLATYHRFHNLTDRLYTPRARAAVGAVDAGAWVRPFLDVPGFPSLLHRLRAANLWLKGAQNIAPRAQQLAAVHGLRLRAPFFDRTLAAWTFALSPAWFLRGACEKFLLKRVADAFLPAPIVWHPKRGMGVPVAPWCAGGLRREVGRWLSPRRLRRDGWFDPAFVAALRRGDAEPGEFRRRRAGEKLWALLMLHVWQEAQGIGT